MMKLDTKTAIQTTIGTLIFALPIVLLAFFLANKNAWAGFELGNAGRIAEYCELNRMTEFTRQRINSWSSLIYVWVGIYCLILAQKDAKKPDPHNLVTRFPIFTVVAAVSFVGLGIGSFIYHASLSVFGQWLDVGFMYACAIVLIGMGILRIQETKMLRQEKKLALAQIRYILITIFIFQAFLFAFKWQMSAKTVLPFLILGLIVMAGYLYSSRILKLNLRLAIVSLASMLIAFAVLTIDLKKILCFPQHVVQGHSIWHLLTAASLLLLYLFFREMKSPKQYL